MGRSIRQLSRYDMLVIATDYAQSPCFYSGDFFSEKYGISKSTFYSVLKKAIVESIVSIEVAKQIMEKAACNTKQHGGEGAEVITRHAYKNKLEERQFFRFDQKEAELWAKRFADSDEDMYTFCNRNCVHIKLLCQAIGDVICNSWLEPEDIDRLKAKRREMLESLNRR